MLQWEVERQDMQMAQMTRKVVDYSRKQRSCCIEILESEASCEVEQYAIEMSSQAMREFCDYEMNAMAGFVRDQFDVKYGQHWNCMVGDSIQNNADGGNVWRESGHYVYLKNGMYKFAIYKSAEGCEQDCDLENNGPLKLGVAESSHHHHSNINHGHHHHTGGDHQHHNHGSSGHQHNHSHSRSQSPSKHHHNHGQGHHRGESGV